MSVEKLPHSDGNQVLHRLAHPSWQAEDPLGLLPAFTINSQQQKHLQQQKQVHSQASKVTLAPNVAALGGLPALQ